MKRGINSYIPGDVNVFIADGVSVIQTSVKDKTQTSAVVDTNQEEMRILKKHFTFGPCQRIASDFNELLKISFKRQLLHFLQKECEDPAYGGILRKNVFYCAIDNECRISYSEDGELKYEEICNLIGYHLEGDTCVVFYTKHADLIDLGNIVCMWG